MGQALRWVPVIDHRTPLVCALMGFVAQWHRMSNLSSGRRDSKYALTPCSRQASHQLSVGPAEPK